MFIGVRLKVVRTWTILPVGGNIAEVFSEKENGKAASTVGGECWVAP